MRSRFLILFALVAAALSAPLVSRAGGETPANSYELVQVGAGFGYDLNDAGHVVGEFFPGGNEHAFLWGNGVFTDLGALGGEYSSAEAVNNLDQVVGWYTLPDGSMRAFRWSQNTGMEDRQPRSP